MRRIRNSSPFSSFFPLSRRSPERLFCAFPIRLVRYCSTLPDRSSWTVGRPPPDPSHTPLLSSARRHPTTPPTHKAAWLLARPLPRDLAVLNMLSYRVLRSSFFLHSLIKAQPGGDEGTRTPDIRLAKAALSHLSYIPRHTLRGSGPDWIRTSDPCVISTVL